MAKLVGTWGGDKTRAVEIPAGRITIGRKSDNNIVLDHKSVSAVHCIVLLEEGQCVVRDLLSTNGTRINGEKITEQVLGHGDMLKIGAIEFLYDERQSATVTQKADSSATIQISLDDLDVPAAIPAETHDGQTEIRPPTAPRARPAPVARPANMQPVMVPKIPTLHKEAVRPPTIVTKRSSRPVAPPSDEIPPVEAPPEPEEAADEAPAATGRKGKAKIRIKSRRAQAAARPAPEPEPEEVEDEEPVAEPMEEVQAAEAEPELEAEPVAEPEPEPEAEAEPVAEAPKKRLRIGGKKRPGGAMRVRKPAAPAPEPAPAEEPAPETEPAAEPEAAKAPAEKPRRFGFKKKSRAPAPAKADTGPPPIPATAAEKPELPAPPVEEPKPIDEAAAEEKPSAAIADDAEAPAESAETVKPASPDPDAGAKGAKAEKRKQPNLGKLRGNASKKKRVKGKPLMPKGTLKKQLAERKAAKKKDAS